MALPTGRDILPDRTSEGWVWLSPDWTDYDESVGKSGWTHVRVRYIVRRDGSKETWVLDANGTPLAADGRAADIDANNNVLASGRPPKPMGPPGSEIGTDKKQQEKWANAQPTGGRLENQQNGYRYGWNYDTDAPGYTIPLGPIDANATKPTRTYTAKDPVTGRDAVASEWPNGETTYAEIRDATPNVADVRTVKLPDGRWVKRTTYVNNAAPPKDEQINPEISVSTTDVGGKKYTIEISKNPDGTSNAPVITDLSTGQTVAGLPVEPTKPHITTHNGDLVSIDATGKVTVLQAGVKEGKLVEVDTGFGTAIVQVQPDGSSKEVWRGQGKPEIVDLGGGRKGAVIRNPQDPKDITIKDVTPQGPALPIEAGGFVPDPRKAAMGYPEYVQQLTALHAAGKLTDQQLKDLSEQGHKTALAEATRLDTVVKAQQQAMQDQITQRANDLQASTSRLNSSNQATATAFSTAVDIAKNLTPKTFGAGADKGASLLGALMGIQDSRGHQWGGFFNPAPIATTGYPALDEITRYPATPFQNAGQVPTNVHQVQAAAAQQEAQTQAAPTPPQAPVNPIFRPSPPVPGSETVVPPPQPPTAEDMPGWAQTAADNALLQVGREPGLSPSPGSWFTPGVTAPVVQQSFAPPQPMTTMSMMPTTQQSGGWFQAPSPVPNAPIMPGAVTEPALRAALDQYQQDPEYQQALLAAYTGAPA